MQKILLIIVHYQNISDTKNVLYSISNPNLLDVIIINNSKMRLELNISKNLKIINSNKNLGYGAGINFGIQNNNISKYKYLVFANNNIRFEKNFFNRLLSQNKKIDLASPVIINPDKSIWFDGGEIDKHRFSAGHKKNMTDYVPGTVMIVNPKVIIKTGMFDTRFFMYYEDADLCLRAKKLGFNIEILKNFFVIHDSKKNIKQNNFMNFHLARNRLLFMKKHANIKTKIREIIRIPKTIFEFIKNQNYSSLKGFLSYILKIFIFIIFFLFKTNVFAEYRMYDKPILSGTYPYEINGVSSPTIVKYKNQYYMYYTSENADGIQSISLAISDDLYNFQKYNKNPIIYPYIGNDHVLERIIHDPEVVFKDDENMLQMYFVASGEPMPTGVPRYWIKYARSWDGINWDIFHDPIIKPTASWEAEGVSGQSVYYSNGVYKMIYAGRDSQGVWRLGLNESVDGYNWFKNSLNPIMTATKENEFSNIAAPDLIKVDDLFSLYYYGAPIWPGENILYANSNDLLVWNKPENNIVLEKNKLGYYIGTPEVIRENNLNKIFFSRLINDKWEIALYEEISDSLTPTQTPTLTPTPIPTIIPTLTLIPSITSTPTPTNIPINNKIIFIPGIFGCWNKEAILHNKETDYKSWKLNPIVNEYKAIIKTFKNIGLYENKDFYIFCYDWRKSIESNINNLKDFVENIINTQGKINIIGHSLGGLIARIYIQKENPKNINKIFTIGSPHLGTSKTYKMVEAGEIDQDNNFQWLGEKLILILNKNALDSDKETIAKNFPIAKDLLPTYNFLEEKDKGFKNYKDLIIKNDFLIPYNESHTNLESNFEVIVGEKGQTDFGFVVEQQNDIDKILQIYPDGRPISTLKSIGDYMVVSQSVKISNNSKIFPYDHGEIVYKKDVIKHLLTELELPFLDSQIEDGMGTKIDNSLIVLVKSPVHYSVFYQDKNYIDNDGIIFIENAEYGEYNIKITGEDFGKYELFTGKIYNSENEWSKYSGEIVNNPPSSQTDNYFINFENKNFISLTQTPTPTPTSSTKNSISETNISSNLKPCDKQAPTQIPKLLSAIPNESSITLIWENYTDSNFDHFLISYGRESEKMEYGVPKISNKNQTVFLIDKLDSNTKYYFKIRAGNDCAPGKFSNELSATTGYKKVFSNNKYNDILGISTKEAVLKINNKIDPINKNHLKNFDNTNKIYLLNVFLIVSIITSFVYVKKIHSKFMYNITN